MATAFSMEFTPKEFSYFLFKKKICPNCGEKMVKERRSEIVDGRIVYKSRKDASYLKRSEVRRYYYVFGCTECGKEYPLTELAK